jgi:hypothetical protein
MRAPVAAAIAIAVGLIVLLGYFLPLEEYHLPALRELLIGWGVILAGVATLIAIVNLLSVHWRKLNDAQSPDYYSLVVLLAFLVTFAAGMWFGPAHPQYQKVVTMIQAPIEASLMGLAAVVLLFACIRLVSHRKGMLGAVFLVSALVFLVIGSGLISVGGDPLLGDTLAFLERLPVAGGRGLLIGMALGSLTAGLRILLGADRPYSG